MALVLRGTRQHITAARKALERDSGKDATMAQYQILYWRDIPAQIKIFEGAKAVSRPLPESFQLAIDKVAMAEGLIGSDAYLNEWHWSPKMERPGTSAEVIELLIQEIVREHETIITGLQGENKN